MAKNSQLHRFRRQTSALTKKTLLIAVVKHPVATLFRALFFPIAFTLLISNIKNFLIASNGFSVGRPQPVQTLKSNILSNWKVVFVQPAGLGPDVNDVVQRIAAPLQNSKQLVFLTDPNDLLTTCQESIQGVSSCFAAVVFNDSPLTQGKGQIWNYTIRADYSLDGGHFSANQHDSDEQLVLLPWQLAIDNAIMNTTITPNEYMYTSITQAEQNNKVRKAYQGLIISTYGIVFFMGMISSVYHLVGMVATERESGMTQLIDAMGGSSEARICSYILAFDIIYFPSWIIVSIVIWAEVFNTPSVLIAIFWQIFTGMAITSASIFAAVFFSKAQLSGVYSILGFLLLGIIGQLVDNKNHTATTSAILSLLFPSMNYMFMIGYVARYERQNLPTNMIHSPQSTPNQHLPGGVSGIVLWIFLWIQIILYPVAAVYVERWVHGSNSRTRVVAPGSTQGGSSDAIEVRGLTKIYPLSFLGQWLSRNTKTTAVVAVHGLSLTAKKGQILCLLGAHGSGKTTTLDMVAGLQRICPQRNVLWDELSVSEHITIWNNIKDSQDDNLALGGLIEACDLTLKKSAPSKTLSGGQKRKLQLACMFVGGSTICLLDEVSSGLDPLSRRMIWNIILAERGKRTMILTTHFLDEADVLADHIAIISRGQLKCEGSAVQLKAQLGGGYRVQLPKITDGPKLPFPTTHIGDQTVYTVPNSGEAVGLLSKLGNLGYTEVFVNGPTVEDVFLKVAKDDVVHNNDPTNNTNIVSDDETLTLEDGGSSDFKLSSGEDLSFVQQSRVLFHKRLTILGHSWYPHAFALLLTITATPAVKTFLAGYDPPKCSGLSFSHLNEHQPLNILSVAQKIGHLKVLAGPSSINQTLYDVLSQFPIGFGLSPSNFTNQFVFQDSLASFEARIASSFGEISPGAIYMDSNNTAPTYAFLGDFRILLSMLIQNLWTQLRSGLAVAAYYAPFDSLIPDEFGNIFEYIAYFGLIQAVYPAFFELYPTSERLRHVRALQYSNGVRPLPMWFSYIVFDSMFVLLIAAICTISVSQEAPWWFGAGYMFPVLALYGIASILFSYIVSLYASSQLRAFGFVAGGQAAMFIISLLVFFIVNTFASISKLQPMLDATTFGLNIILPIGNVVRSLVIGFNSFNVNCRNNHYISTPGSIYAYGGPILYLVLQIVSWSSRQWAEMLKRRLNEWEILNRIFFACFNLPSDFGPVTAVDNISFNLSTGIFALLGPNGAGKSTTIDMIHGELRPDNGVVLLQGVNVLTDLRAARKYLGVCPQFDALDILTTRQHLEFYARAKGIPNIEHDVDTVIAKVGLTGYEERLASKLSGGNKRKLSLAIALLGNPKVLILDEPSSSMDAASKRVMWKVLSEIKEGRSILLTTHSMEEADALATRAAIISKRILAIGTPDFPRKNHGDFYHVHIILSSAPSSSTEEMKSIENWALNTFDGVSFDAFGSHHGQIRFSVPAVRSDSASEGKREGVRELFELLEKNKEGMGLNYYSVGATTLDQVFLNVVRENNVLEQGYGVVSLRVDRRWMWCF